MYFHSLISIIAALCRYGKIVEGKEGIENLFIRNLLDWFSMLHHGRGLFEMIVPQIHKLSNVHVINTAKLSHIASITSTR